MSKELTRLFDELQTVFPHPRVLGFGPLFNEIRDYVTAPDVNYPKYNVVQTGDDQYLIEIAATGFDPSDIVVEVERHTLTVSASNEEPEVQRIYQHRGIARRDFKLAIHLGERMEVGEPVMKNGLISIPVVHVKPPEETPRRLEVKSA